MISKVTNFRTPCVSISMNDETKRTETDNYVLVTIFKLIVARALIAYAFVSVGCASSSAAAKTKSSKKGEPLWVTDCAQAYPSAEYIAATGTGASADESVSASTAALARYFNAQISAETNASRTITQSDTGVTKTRTVNENTGIVSSTELKALHSTEPYFTGSKKDGNGQWICASYIKRSEAWTLLEGELKQHVAAFDTPYDNAQKEENKLLKVLYLASAKKASAALEDSLLYAKIISPSKALWYAGEDDRIASCIAELTATSLGCPIYVSVENDNDTIIYNAIVSILANNGFTVSKDESCPYHMDASASMNGFTSDGSYFFYPSVTAILST